MSTIPPPPAPPPAPAPPRRLVRMEDQGKIAGVAAGIGWYFGIDPVLVRIALVVLTIGTGLGIPAYIIAWVVLPGVKSTDTDLPSPPAPTEGRPLAILVIGTVVALLLLGQIDLFSGEVMTAAVLIGIGVLLFTDASSLGLGARRAGNRHHRGGPPPWAGTGPWQAPPAPPAQQPHGQQPPPHQQPPVQQPPPSHQPPTAYSAAAPGQAPWTATPPVPPEPRPAPHCGPKRHSAYAPYAGAWRQGPPTPVDQAPRRPRSFLGGLAFAAWLVTIGLAALLDRIGAVTLTPVRVMALTLTVAGIALVIGTLFGRARGLIVIGVLASLLLLPLTAVQGHDVPLSGGVGERQSTPTSVADVPERYEMLVGSQTIDLTDLDLDGQTVDVVARMGAGELVIQVPEDADVQVRGTLQAGDYSVLGENRSGTSHAFNVTRDGDPAVGRIQLDISVLVGEVTVETVQRR